MALFPEDKRDSKKVRFAVVGLGWIAQEMVLPAFQNTNNSELTALVTHDATKAEELGKKYEVSQGIGYEGYDGLLRSGFIDAVYLALPNSMHKDYTVRAAHAGIHVLCEKPMADSVTECEEMIHAAEQNAVKLMVAYRLHFEPANLKAVELIQNGEIGEPRIFSSIFSQQVGAANIRLKRDKGGGPLMDMGIYQINASRYLFQDEPIEVVGAGANGGDPRFNEVHEMATGILRFPGDQMAVFACSFGAAQADALQVVGTKGELWLQPAFDYHTKYKLRVKAEGKEKEISVDKVDQFGAEIEYFSQCVLEGTEPEPSGHEGLADVRVIDALLQSMRSRNPVKLARFEKRARPGKQQEIRKSPIKPQKLIHAESASASD
jgi:predicted dehydrogenase